MVNKVEIITKYYNEGSWDIYRVRHAVDEKLITPEEYEDITGEEYPGDWDGDGGDDPVAVQADWNQNNPSASNYIKNKPTLGELAGKDTVEIDDINADVAVLNEEGEIDVSCIPVEIIYGGGANGST